jgi:hypothetical protein
MSQLSAAARAVPARNLPVRRKRAELRADFEAAVPALSDFSPERYPSGVLSWAHFLWACAAFASRAFPLRRGAGAAGGQLRLVSTVEQRATTRHDTGDRSGRKRRRHGNDTMSSSATVAATAAAAAAAAPLRQQCLLPLLDMFNHAYRAPILWESRGPAATVGFATGGPVSQGQEVFNNYVRVCHCAVLPRRAE